MEAYRERLAERIDKELQRRGEDHNDLAHALRVNPRTAERWTSGDTTPQRRLRKPIADYLGLPIEELWPDLEADEKALRDQLDRIEAKLDELLNQLPAERLDEVLEEAARQRDEQTKRTAAELRRKTPRRKAS